jgi:hypothetical protein
VVDRPFATDPYKCRFHEASPDICDFLFDQLVSKAISRRGYSRLVPPLTGRPKCSCWFTSREDVQRTLLDYGRVAGRPDLPAFQIFNLTVTLFIRLGPCNLVRPMIRLAARRLCSLEGQYPRGQK